MKIHLKLSITVILSVLLLQNSSSGRIEGSKMNSWKIDTVKELAGYPTKVLGNPQVKNVITGKALYFDGIDDGLIIDANPLEGALSFTIEVYFRPDSAYPDNIAQRFIHIQDPANGARRVLLELRVTKQALSVDEFSIGLKQNKNTPY